MTKLQASTRLIATDYKARERQIAENLKDGSLRLSQFDSMCRAAIDTDRKEWMMLMRAAEASGNEKAIAITRKVRDEN